MLAVDQRTVRRYLKEIEREYELSPLRPRGGGPCLWRIRPGEIPRKVEIRRAQAYALLATRGIFEALQGSAVALPEQFGQLDDLLAGAGA